MPVADGGPIEPVIGPRLDWNGEPTYLQGANLPWIEFGCDFGCGANGGASSAASRTVLDATFANASEAGIRLVRWWLFPGDPVQFERDPLGFPTGLTDATYDDIDAALDVAAAHDITFVFTLFSGPSTIPESWLTLEPGRQRLAEVLGELFARYRDEPRIHTWQVINEPEWQIEDGTVAEADVRDLVEKIADSVHANSSALVSVGSARLDNLPMWVGAGLDYYTAHWYDPMGDGENCAVCTDYGEIAELTDLDAPLVIGEFYAGTETNPAERLQSLYDRGYAGAWAWSLLPDRTEDELAIDLGAMAAFSAANDDVIP